MIVDDLRANPTCGEVTTTILNGLRAGFTSRQVAGLIVYAARWYGPDVLPLLKTCADTYGGGSDSVA